MINTSHGENLQVRGSIEDGFYVENLFQTYIETMDELLTILEEGLNEEISRIKEKNTKHSIFSSI